MARIASFGLALICATSISGCGFMRSDASRTLGGGPADIAASKMTTIGVNAYLWQASLDTLSFAPLLQADSSGGVIITDWYANPNSPDERMKVTATILDKDLRADALRVAASRQVMQNGQWIEVAVSAATVQKLEEIILTKARDLRRNAITN